MSDETVKLEVEGPIVTLSLNRPKRKNAMDTEMWTLFTKKVEEVKALSKARVLILKSNVEGAFSAGADIDEFERIGQDEGLREKNRLAIEKGFKAITELDIPSIALINGGCYGAGVGLILGCDFRIATPQSKFAITPAKLGIIYPLPETRRLQNLVGPSNARYLLFSAAPIDANHARQMGLLNKVVEKDFIKQEVSEFAEAMAQNSRAGIKGIKKIFEMIEAGAEDNNPDAQSLFKSLYSGEDFKEGAMAFREKRKPDFK